MEPAPANMVSGAVVRAFAAWLTVLVAAALALPAVGQQVPLSELSADSKAELLDLLRAGNDAFDRGDYPASLAHYQAALALAELPELQYRLALCLDKLGRFEDAASAYARFLELEPEARDRERIQAEMERLQVLAQAARYTTVRLSSLPPGATVRLDDGTTLGTTPLEARLAAGQLALVLELDGFHPRREVLQLAGGAVVETSFDLEPLSTLTVTSEPPGARVSLVGAGSEQLGVAPLAVQVVPGELSVRVELDGYRVHEEVLVIERGEARKLHVALVAEDAPLVVAGWSTLLGGGAAAVGATVLWFVADAKTVKANAYEPGRGGHTRDELNRLRVEARSWQVATWVTGSAAGVALLAGSALLLVSALQQDEDTAISSLGCVLSPEGFHVAFVAHF